MRPGAAAAWAVALAACGGAAGGGAITPGPPPVPARAATAGEPLLPLLPDGAEVVVELDLARLYANPVVGEVARAWLAGGELAVPGDALAPGAAAAADVVVLAAYGVGSADAATLTLLAGAGVDAAAVPAARAVTPGVIAVGPAALVDVAVARAGAGAEGLGEVDAELRALRAAAMPAQADGAVVRITARLGFDARVALAAAVGVDVAPATLSVWADVADDLAVIARLGAGAEAGAGAETDARAEVAALREMAADALGAVAGLPASRRLGVAPAVRAATLTAGDDGVAVIALIGPRRLARAVDRARAALPAAATPPGADDPALESP